MGTPLFDKAASGTDEAAWNRWRQTPDNQAMLLTKRELADILEAMLALSEAIDAKPGAGAANETSGTGAAGEPMRQLVKSILNVSDREVIIDGGTY